MGENRILEGNEIVLTMHFQSFPVAFYKPKFQINYTKDFRNLKSETLIFLIFDLSI